MLLLLDNYDSFTHNLYHLIGLYTQDIQIIRNDQVCLSHLSSLYNQGQLEGMVLSPGPGRPEDAGLMLKTIEKFLGKVPILGVCLGHQAIGMVFGAKVVKAKTIFHGKPSEVIHSGKGLYQGIRDPLIVARYHSLCVDMTGVKDVQIDAKTKEGTVMGISSEKLNCYGLQFHPESVLTKQGDLLIENFLKTTKKLALQK